METTPPSKRHQPRISTACSSCRLKKIRCDAILPSCTNCSAARIECLVVNTDKRRKKTKITQVKDLQAQLLALEKSLAAARNDSEQLKLQPNALSIASGSNVTLDTITFSTAPAINLDNPSPNNSSKRRRDVVDFGTPLAEEPFTTFVVDPEESVEIDMGQQTPWLVAPSALAAQLTGTYGRLSVSDGGELRFYGATSSRHISFGGGVNSQVSNSTMLRTRVNDALSRLGLLSPLVSPELEERLLRLYFCWHNPFFQVVDEEVFYRHRALYAKNSPECKFYSPALLFAILSYTVHFSDEAIALLGNSPADSPDTAGDKFMARAAACLDLELDSPQTNTVQTLCIMAAREAGCGRDARGWTYIGMSAMIAIDLGLHKDSTPWLDAGRLSKEDVSVRNQVWWGMFCYASLWSLYLGRPLVMLTESDTPHPLTNASSYIPWNHLGDLNEILPSPDPLGSFSDQNLRGSLVLLLQITDSIVKQLYSAQTGLGRSTSSLIEWSADVHARLVDWKASLSLSLRLVGRPLPHTLILHLQYHSTLILLHRPSLCDQYGKILQDGLSFKTCCSSAASVTQLLEQYLHLYTFRRISVVATHQIFTSATVNVFIIYLSATTVGTTQEEPTLRRSARKGLLVCIAALASIATNQVHARRCYLSIVMLMKKWGISLDEPPTAMRDPYQMFTSTNITPVALDLQSQLSSQATSIPTQTAINSYSLLDQSQQFDRFSRELLALSDDYSISNSLNAGGTLPIWSRAETSGDGPITHHTPPSPILVLNPDATVVDPAFFDFDPYLSTGPDFGWEGPSLFDMFSFPSLD